MPVEQQHMLVDKLVALTKARQGSLAPTMSRLFDVGHLQRSAMGFAGALLAAGQVVRVISCSSQFTSARVDASLCKQKDSLVGYPLHALFLFPRGRAFSQ